MNKNLQKPTPQNQENIGPLVYSRLANVVYYTDKYLVQFCTILNLASWQHAKISSWKSIFSIWSLIATINFRKPVVGVNTADVKEKFTVARMPWPTNVAHIRFLAWPEYFNIFHISYSQYLPTIPTNLWISKSVKKAWEQKKLIKKYNKLPTN